MSGSASPSSAPTPTSSGNGPFWVSLIALTVITGYAYFDTIQKAAERWSNDPQYSHGYLVPLFSLYLLYRRRDMLVGQRLVPTVWAVIPAMIAAALRLLEGKFFYNGLDALSIVPAFLAVLLAAGGKPALRWGWSAAAFLIFMVPLPFRLQTFLSTQLQALATTICTVVLVMLGYPAVSEGNVIVLEDVRVGVVDACSGLGMVVTFAALSAGFALVTKSALWVKIALLLGALPVAVLANVVRIVGTAMLFQADHNEAARNLYHDAAGWLMIPLGCVFILAELWVLDRVLLPAEPRAAAPVSGPVTRTKSSGRSRNAPLNIGVPGPKNPPSAGQ